MLSAIWIVSGRALDVVKALSSVELVTSTVKDARDNVETFHDKWYSEACCLAEKLEVTPSAPCVCKRQSHGSNATVGSDPSDYYRVNVTIPFLDHLSGQMDERFTT